METILVVRLIKYICILHFALCRIAYLMVAIGALLEEPGTLYSSANIALN